MLNQETAKAARTDSGYILRAPRRMRVADAVAQYMRVTNSGSDPLVGVVWADAGTSAEEVPVKLNV
ncbi:TPA: hypothetical protein JL141_002311 [Escherichia coli]|nr:hypothetical protein [Escherichia coli]